MKLLPSSSTSSSPSSSVSFDPTMCTSKSATAGCIAGIFRRILCSRSLPTHPSDSITEGSSGAIDKHQGLEVEDKIEAPGIVARLMGLDTMPEIGQAKPNSSISRSKLMNSVDYTHYGSDQEQNKHTQVNYTMSFREMPKFLVLEEEEFFVLSFEKEGKGRDLRAKQRKQSKGKKNITKKVFSERKNRENHQEMTMSKKALCVLIEQEQEMNRRISDKSDQDFALSNIKALERKRKKKKGKWSAVENVQHECSSQDSSPVSVLDFDQFIVDQEVPTLHEDLKLEGSRRKLSPEPENYGSPCGREDDILMDNCEGKSPRLRKKEWHSQFWDAICKLTETEVGNSIWLNSMTVKHEEVEDIAAAVGLQILDQLLDELMVLQ
ncbi:hypothetical protein SLE2022_351400 [Rubroshorea leprosula]